MSAAIQILQNGDAILAFTYDADTVERLKHGIPAYAREWRPDDKQWRIAAGPFVGVAIQIMREEFAIVNVFDDRRDTGAPPPPPFRSPDMAYSTLHLQPTAPPEVVEAVYKTMAKLVHPDRGGTTADMQAINEAVAEIRNRQLA